ncbi:MAG: hypothetical protein JKX83_03600 [Pseudomonadales bacterium]|nr:hypothetical protein [Pseudomonadales bacterium]
MKRFLFILAFISAPLISVPLIAAERPLTLDLLNAIKSTGDQFTALESKYPDLFGDEDEDMSMDEAVIFLKKSKAYPDIKDILSSNGIDSVEQYYEVIMRLAAGFQHASMQQSADFRNYDASLKQLEDHIRSLKEGDAHPEIISSMLEAFEQMKGAKTMMNKASAADKAFVANNLAAVQGIFPADNEEPEY